MGEAPGNQEIVKGEPFVGPSGQLLQAALDEYGIAREQVTLTNACLCHYPQSMKALPKEAIAACQPRLMYEIELSGATTVIPMGNSAVQAVFPKTIAKRGITQLRAGRPKTSDLLPSALAVVPTFHPAACLRSQEKFPRMLGDIGKAASVANLPDLWYPPEIELFTVPYLASLAIDRILASYRGKSIVLDIETGREKDISYGNIHMNVLLCVGVGPVGGVDKDKVYVFADSCFESKVFRTLFQEMLDVCLLEAQNGKFDIGSLRSYLGYADFESPKLHDDTMLKSYALYEYQGVHGLEYLGMELLGTPDWKHDIEPYLRGDEGKGDVDYGNIPRDILYRYNAFDVHATRLLSRYLGDQVKERGLEDGYRFTIRASNTLTLIEPRGLGFDLQYSAVLAARLQTERIKHECDLPVVSDPTSSNKKLQELHRLNPDSPKQVSQYFEGHGVKLDNTEADTLRELLPKYEISDEVKGTVRTILAIRAITKTDGTFVSGLAKRVTPEGTVHPSFLIHGTTSGRLSSRNPNSQNIPRSKDIKRQFVARDANRTLVGVDMSQAELRVLAWLAKDQGLREIFNDPERDLFVELCRMMFPVKFASSTFKEVKDDPIRPLVKGAVYGLAYGRTATGIAMDPAFNMTVQEAQDILNKLSAVIPGVIQFLDDTVERVMNLEDLVTPFGRHRRFHLITAMNQHSVANEAKSFFAQSIASDIVLEAACRLTEIHKVFIVNLVHDAIYADVLIEDAERTANLISQVMIEVAEEVTEGYVRFATDKKIGRSWADV